MGSRLDQDFEDRSDQIALSSQSRIDVNEVLQLPTQSADFQLPLFLTSYLGC